MDKVFMFFAALGSFLILCQWFVFVSVRKYVFQPCTPVSRPVAYSALVIMGLVNLVAVKLVFDAHWLAADSRGQQLAAVAFFTGLGFSLALSLLFLVLGTVSQILNLKSVLFTVIHRWANGLESPKGHVREGVSVSPVGTEGHAADAAPRPRTANDGSPAGSGPAASPDCLGQSSARRTFLKWSAATGLAGVVGSGAHGIAEAYQEPVTEEFDLFDPRLGGLTRPLTLIQVTDFHFGMFYGSYELNHLVDRLNSMEGDLVCITGDVFHSPLTAVELAPPILRKLKARRFGNVAVLGNHDFYTGERRSVDAIRAAGLTLLRDEWVTYRDGSATIHLGGIDDPMANWIWGKDFPRFGEFAARAPRGPGMRILLSHRPSVLPVAADEGIDFILSGHIHGGQVILPRGSSDRGWSLAGLVSPYTHGWYRIGWTHMYLSRGIGLTFVPWRINCPPEITVFHLLASGDKNGPEKRPPEYRGRPG